MKRKDIAFLLWILYRILCVGFMSMFLAGLTIGILWIAGLNSPFLSYINYLMIGGTGGMVLMRRTDETAKKLLKISGI